MSSKPQFSIGLEFGSEGLVAVLVDLRDGNELAAVNLPYPSGKDAELLVSENSLMARRNPAEYLSCLKDSLKILLNEANDNGFEPSGLAGIGVAAVGSTLIPVDENGNPLAFSERFADIPAAMAWLNNDRSGHEEAKLIARKVSREADLLLRYSFTRYRSEWFFSKILHCKSENPEVFAAAHTWVELADYIPGYLTGTSNPDRLKRGVSAAGHFAMFNAVWGGWANPGLFRKIDPELVTLRERLSYPAVSPGKAAGVLDTKIAEELGLPVGISIAIGAIASHSAAIACGIRPGTFLKIIGPDSCDVTVFPPKNDLREIPGVPDSIIPGMHSLMNAQTPLERIFDWLLEYMRPADFISAADPYDALSLAAAKIAPGETGLLALDWNEGNDSSLDDPFLRGLILGQSLKTSVPDIYRAFIEAAGFEALTVLKRYEKNGLKVDDFLIAGRLGVKNPLIVQIFADIFKRPFRVVRNEQIGALGAAILGAVAGKVFSEITAAQEKLAAESSTPLVPGGDPRNVYPDLFELYTKLHKSFGTPKYKLNLFMVMKDLIEMRRVRCGV